VKKLINLFLLIGAFSANASSFTPYYDNFSYNGAAGHEVENKTIIKTNGPRSKKFFKGVSFKLDGRVASCGNFKFREIFPKIKTEVVSCNKNVMMVHVEYLRVSACNQERLHDEKEIIVKLPTGCDFNAREGIVTVYNRQKQQQQQAQQRVPVARGAQAAQVQRPQQHP
tara:strand:- start:591 stop:1097 length:507 start_codon:yes stop_codon:yes gene_type:complete